MQYRGTRSKSKKVRRSSVPEFTSTELPESWKEKALLKNQRIHRRRRKREKRREEDLKFSAVLGAMSAKSSILIRPAGIPPIETSKKTTGFLGLGGLTCHSTFPPPLEGADAAPVGPATIPPPELIRTQTFLLLLSLTDFGGNKKERYFLLLSLYLFSSMINRFDSIFFTFRYSDQRLNKTVVRKLFCLIGL